MPVRRRARGKFSGVYGLAHAEIALLAQLVAHPADEWVPAEALAEELGWKVSTLHVRVCYVRRAYGSDAILTKRDRLLSPGGFYKVHPKVRRYAA